jgi:hypothetical protein
MLSSEMYLHMLSILGTAVRFPAFVQLRVNGAWLFSLLDLGRRR